MSHVQLVFKYAHAFTGMAMLASAANKGAHGSCAGCSHQHLQARAPAGADVSVGSADLGSDEKNNWRARAAVARTSEKAAGPRVIKAGTIAARHADGGEPEFGGSWLAKARCVARVAVYSALKCCMCGAHKPKDGSCWLAKVRGVCGGGARHRVPLAGVQFGKPLADQIEERMAQCCLADGSGCCLDDGGECCMDDGGG